MRVLGDTKRSKERAAEIHEYLVVCFIVLFGGVTTRGSRGPAITLTMAMKAWGS